MLAKYWKKIGLFILIVACLFNIINKLVRIVSFDTAIETIRAHIVYIQER